MMSAADVMNGYPTKPIHLCRTKINEGTSEVNVARFLDDGWSVSLEDGGNAKHRRRMEQSVVGVYNYGRCW